MELTSRLINRNFGWVATALLLLAALFRIPGPIDQGRAYMQAFCEAWVLLTVAWVVWAYVDKWLGAMVALVVFSWLYVFFLHQHGSAATFQRVAYFSRNYFVFGAVAVAVFAFAVKFGHEEKLLTATALIGFANFVFIALQHLGIDPFRYATLGLMKSTFTQPTGVFFNPNETSAVFAFCTWACVDGWRRMFLPFCVAGLFMAASTGGFFALAIGGAFWFLAKGYRLRWVIAVATVLMVASLAADGAVLQSFTDRVRIWSLGDKLLSEAPVLGYGIGAWPLMTRQMYAHNDFLQFWFEVGYGGILLILGFLASMVAKLGRATITPAAAVVTVAANSVFGFSMHIAAIGLIAAMWIGLLCAKQGEKRCGLRR